MLLGLILGGAIIYGQSIVTKIWVDKFDLPAETEAVVTPKSQTEAVEEETLLFSTAEGTIRQEKVADKHNLYTVEIDDATITFRPDVVQFTARDARGVESTVALRLADEQSLFDLAGVNEQSTETVNLPAAMSTVLRANTMEVTYFEQLQYNHSDGTTLLFSVLDGDLLVEMSNQNNLPNLRAFWMQYSDYWNLEGEASEVRRNIRIKSYNATTVQGSPDGTINIQGSSSTSAFLISL